MYLKLIQKSNLLFSLLSLLCFSGCFFSKGPSDSTLSQDSQKQIDPSGNGTGFGGGNGTGFSGDNGKGYAGILKRLKEESLPKKRKKQKAIEIVKSDSGFKYVEAANGREKRKEKTDNLSWDNWNKNTVVGLDRREIEKLEEYQKRLSEEDDETKETKHPAEPIFAESAEETTEEHEPSIRTTTAISNNSLQNIGSSSSLPNKSTEEPSKNPLESIFEIPGSNGEKAINYGGTLHTTGGPANQSFVQLDGYLYGYAGNQGQYATETSATPYLGYVSVPLKETLDLSQSNFSLETDFYVSRDAYYSVIASQALNPEDRPALGYQPNWKITVIADSKDGSKGGIEFRWTGEMPDTKQNILAGKTTPRLSRLVWSFKNFSFPFQIGKWYHLSVVRISSKLFFYVDGKSIGYYYVGQWPYVQFWPSKQNIQLGKFGFLNGNKIDPPLSIYTGFNGGISGFRIQLAK